MTKITDLWGAIRTILRNQCTSRRTIQIVSPTGIDVRAISEYSSSVSSQDKDKVIKEIEATYYALSEDKKEQFLEIIVEEIVGQCPEKVSQLTQKLERLGWTVYEGSLVQIEVLDITELPELPKEAREDLIKAAIRYRDGDLSGAVTSSCGAVDSVTARIYQEMPKLDKPGDASFQEKVVKSLREKQITNNIQDDLVSLGWQERDAEIFIKNLEGSINQAAYVMQTLRSKMGDTHGTKPTLKPIVYDTIKWAQIITRLLK